MDYVNPQNIGNSTCWVPKIGVSPFFPPNHHWLVVLTLPLWKMMEWKSVGIIPNIWKNNPNVPVTTNQIKFIGQIVLKQPWWRLGYAGIFCSRKGGTQRARLLYASGDAFEALPGNLATHAMRLSMRGASCKYVGKSNAIPIGSMVLPYMVTFTINIPQSC